MPRRLCVMEIVSMPENRANSVDGVYFDDDSFADPDFVSEFESSKMKLRSSTSI